MVIVVEIEDRCVVKPFLGGWRNVVTGTEYHDARTQTCPRDNVVYPSARRKEERQRDEYDLALGTCVTPTSNVIIKTREKCVGTDVSLLMVVLASSRSKYTSVVNEQGTQTSRLPDLRDKLVTPLAIRPTKETTTTSRTTSGNKSSLAPLASPKMRKSDGKQITEDTEKHLARLEELSAVKIQKCYRAYRARIDIGALARLARETRALTPTQPEKIHHFRHCRVSQFEILNVSPPSKRSDFEMVDNVLERWRYYESERLERGFFTTSKLAARATILQREIELLRSIETIKLRVRGERKERKYLESLDRLAESEVWKCANGKRTIRVDTLRVQRARECRDFYRSLIEDDFASDARLEILKNLRIYANGHTCKYANDLVSLIDQEIELTSENYDLKIMNSLKNRLRHALLRFTMNFCAPENKFDRDRFTKCEETSRTKKSSFSRLCKRCGKFLSIDVISSSIDELLPTCENCRKLQPGKEARIVYEPYEIMLGDLKNREIDLDPTSENRGIAWIVDSRIIYRLVNYIWHGKSAISECDDLFRLSLVRFKMEREWSPWNTLVLTRREAALHQTMTDPWQIYAPAMIKKFVIKNLQAKLRFDFVTREHFMSDRTQ